MTGAELRAWRERLGKDEAWIEAVLGGVNTPHLPRTTNREWMVERRTSCEDARRPFSPESMECFRAAYRAALDAEERAQAERGPVEPVCPEGVEERGVFGGIWLAVRGRDAAFFVLDSGDVRSEGGRPISPALLEYAAALSRCRAALHAASDRQRKLDAVRAAEEAHRRTKAEYDRATLEHNAAARALLDARREAGL